MVEELIDVVNEQNELLNKTTNYQGVHMSGAWHRAAHIWVFNSRGEILIQKRSKQKFTFPDLWDTSAAGHISSGEDPLFSAQRELEEELGIKTKSGDLKFFKIQKEQNSWKDLKENEFCYIYTFKYDGPVENFKLQVEEVSEIKFMPIGKFAKDFRLNPKKYVFHNYIPELLAKIKEG